MRTRYRLGAVARASRPQRIYMMSACSAGVCTRSRPLAPVALDDVVPVEEFESCLRTEHGNPPSPDRLIELSPL